MPNENYLRKYQLFIGFPEAYYKVNTTKVNQGSYSNVIDGEVEGFTDLNPPELMTIPKEAGVFIDDLRVTCEVNGTTESSGSDTRKASIRIYNANQNTRAKLNQKNLKVILKAGYLDDLSNDSLPVLVSGQVSRVTHSREGSNIVTTLQVSDGFTPHTTSKVNVSLPSDYLRPITARNVLQYLVNVWKANGVSSDNSTIEYDFTLDSVKYYAGWTGTGYLKDVMDTFCDQNSLEWYTVNSTLYVQRKGSTQVKELFMPNTSNLVLIESIVNPQSSSSETEEVGRVKVELVLDARMKEGAFVEIPKNLLREDKKSLTGVYKIKRVSHIFDSFQGTSRTTLEGDKV